MSKEIEGTRPAVEEATHEEQQEMDDTVLSPEKAEEQKFFDSGDYNMAKAKVKNKQQLPAVTPAEKAEITGDHIPTPQDIPQRKPSIVASKLAG
ncbi:unnamed protein product [Coregonus sp. 'balchen']|nr:unnamed protein product [Coregonus sp. 'balchen']